ncbi:MAG: CCA tRNA nucleotidyltransferase [Treponemataceae bacterium]
MKISIPRELKKMAEIFSQHGFEAFLVGGAVRDMVMKKKAQDWDLATNASPHEVTKIFQRTIPTGIAHGTVTVIFMNHHIEVTTYRLESTYSDGRHPDAVHYTSSLEEDLSRRDFTINAMAANLFTGVVFDPFDGMTDIKKKIIRTVGKPLDRFGEDGLRAIRAIRFASKLNFLIEEQTFNAINQVIEVTKKVAIERFQDEFTKMLQSDCPSYALDLMEKTGLLECFLPELFNCRGVEQKGFHQFDVLTHLFFSCNASPKEKITVRLAALFHDVGKPLAKKVNFSLDDVGNKIEEITFYHHEIISAQMTEKILTRLHFSNAIIKNVCHLIKNHMFHYEENWSDSAVRRFLMRIQYNENPLILQDLFDLRYADTFGQQGKPVKNLLIDFQYRIESILKEEAALSLKDLAVSGNDLLTIGIPKGKQIGFILNELLETVLEEPKSNTKESLLLIAKNLYINLTKI